MGIAVNIKLIPRFPEDSQASRHLMETVQKCLDVKAQQNFVGMMPAGGWKMPKDPCSQKPGKLRVAAS